MKQRILTIVGTFILPIVLLGAVWLFDSTPAIRAATFDVCATGCDYTTISAAVSDVGNVPDGSVINVLAGTYTDNVLLTRTMTIQGPGAGAAIVNGGPAGPVLEIDTAISATIKSLIIQNGLSINGGGVRNEGVVNIVDSIIQNNEAPCEEGGGIVNYGRMYLQHVTIRGNKSAIGGGIFNDGTIVAEQITLTLNSTVVADLCGSTGGGIENLGSFYLTDSVVQNNESTLDGGGIENAGVLTVSLSIVSGNDSQVEGGGINTVIGGMTTVMSSTIRDNKADRGGGVSNEGTLGVTSSVIHGNSAAAAGSVGGGMHNRAGGVLAVVNSTISENTASRGGGVYNEGSGTTAVLRSSTLYNNSGLPGGGISNITGTVTLSNSIVAHNSAQALGFDCVGSGIVSTGSNMDSDDSCGLGMNELRGVSDPRLGLVQDNGGPTWTNALLIGSPAMDTATVCEPTDQRGIARPVGNACDIGAYETRGFKIYLPVILRN